MIPNFIYFVPQYPDIKPEIVPHLGNCYCVTETIWMHGHAPMCNWHKTLGFSYGFFWLVKLNYTLMFLLFGRIIRPLLWICYNIMIHFLCFNCMIMLKIITSEYQLVCEHSFTNIHSSRNNRALKVSIKTEEKTKKEYHVWIL